MPRRAGTTRTGLRVLMIASEAQPFSKTGGLADVAAALPKALAQLGHHVTLITPRYRGVTDGPVIARLAVDLAKDDQRAVLEGLLQTRPGESPAAAVESARVFLLACRFPEWADPKVVAQSAALSAWMDRDPELALRFAAAELLVCVCVRRRVRECSRKRRGANRPFRTRVQTTAGATGESERDQAADHIHECEGRLALSERCDVRVGGQRGGACARWLWGRSRRWSRSRSAGVAWRPAWVRS